MLIWYYIVCIIVSIVAISIGQPLWAILPAGVLVLGIVFDLQSKHTSITSLGQLITDNIMLVSWIALMIGMVWIGHIVGYSLIIMSICMTIVTILSYCASVALQYEDGEIVRHQSSIFLIVATSIIIIVSLIAQYDSNLQLGQYIVGIITILLIITGSIMVMYTLIAHIRKLPYPSYIRDELVANIVYYMPAGIILTFLFHNVLFAAACIMILYIGYGYALEQIKHYDLRHLNQPEITLDLILKGYKTNHIHQLTQHKRLQQIAVTIESLSYTIKKHIMGIVHVVMAGSYLYLTQGVLSTGLSIGDFVLYCLTFAGYIAINYLYQKQPYMQINTLAQGFVIGYLTITVMLMTIFESDPVGGSITAIFWVIINALLVTQYHQLNLDQYIDSVQTHWRVWANTAGGALTIIVATQLPIDGILKLPILLVIIAVLGFSITQSYLTLKKLPSK